MLAECVSFSYQPCQARLTLINVNFKEVYDPLYDLFTFSTDKCDGSCNAIDNPYAWICVPKNMSVKLFNLKLRVKEIKIFSSAWGKCKIKIEWNCV